MVGQEDEGENNENMSHKDSYKWIRRTKYIPSIGFFYNVCGDFYLMYLGDIVVIVSF